MNLYLMRHTKPVNGHPNDGSRVLTADGEKQALAMSKWLVKLIGRVDIVITSPMKRAIQTATIAAKELGAHIADSKMLEPDGAIGEAWEEIKRLAQQSKDVLVVGHDPCLNGLLADFMGVDIGDLDGTGVLRLEWGSVAFVKIRMDGDIITSAVLQWLITPALVLRPEDEQELVEAARAFASQLS